MTQSTDFRAAAPDPARDALEVRTEPLGGSPLARAALAGQVPPGWYAPAPRDADEWRLHADAVRRQFAAGAWLDVLAPAFDTRGAAAIRLDRVAGGAGVIVTTGQQPGLFGGPLYTLSKALTALALADALEAETGIPAAPVFWAATDDADFAEASRTTIATPHGPVSLAVATDVPDGTPMSAVPLAPDVARLGLQLQDAAGARTHGAALRDALETFVPGETVGGAYVAWLRRTLEPLGIAVLDASHPAVQDGAFQLLRRALLASSSIARALAERSAEIVAAGFTPQVEDVPGRSVVFRYDAAGRKARVPIDEARGLVTKVGRGELGPNVVLRPVVERFLLPTVAYAAGPGEYAYFAQVSAVATALGVSQPLAVPRWSGTIVEPHVRRVLTRLGASVDDVADADALAGRLARDRLPQTMQEALAGLRADVDTRVAQLRATLGLAEQSVVDGARTQLAHKIDRLERRLVAAEKRRDDQVAGDVATAAAALYPGGTRQERVLNAVPLLARHGPAIVDAMLEQARIHARRLVTQGVHPPTSAIARRAD